MTLLGEHGQEHIYLCVYVEVGPGVFTCTHAGGGQSRHGMSFSIALHIIF